MDGDSVSIGNLVVVVSILISVEMVDLSIAWVVDTSNDGISETKALEI